MSRVLSAVLPWPTREERRAQVEEARLGAEQAQQQAAESRTLIREIRDLRRENHVTEALNQMIQRRAREH